MQVEQVFSSGGGEMFMWQRRAGVQDSRTSCSYDLVCLKCNVNMLFYYYYYKRIWLQCHKIIGLQGHFTIERTRIKHDTEKREENRQTQSGPHRKKSSVLRRCLKTVNDVDEVTLDGRLLHTREGKARSRVANGGMARRRYDECRRWRWPQPPLRV